MGAVSIMPRRGDWTYADLEQLPDDGLRYELIDGTLLVSPSPRLVHQRMVGHLYLRLVDACTEGMEVLLAPFDVVLSQNTVIEPDLLVTRTADLTDMNLPGPPLLAVEVLSPSTRLIDLNLKKAKLEQAGCPSYWVVDPEQPRLLAWELREGAYVEVADVSDEDAWTSVRPFPVTICPADLVN